MSEQSHRESTREQPRDGGRVTAWLVTKPGPDGVRYDVELATREGRWSLDASLAASGDIQLSSCSAPDWLGDYVRALLRGLWRQHHESGRWPRRITRWRDEPKATR